MLSSTNDVSSFIPLPTVQNKLVIEKSEKQAQLKEQIYNQNVARAEAILTKYNSPFAGLGYIIVQKTEECGGDFRFLLAIAGNESGFGRIPYKQYNPFGYLNGVTYSGWEEALSVLSCKIAQQYLVPCDSKPECIVVKYAGPSDDKQQWIKNIYYFANQI